MLTTLKKFDMEAAIGRRIKELCGERVPALDIDEITRYTSRRIREMRESGDMYSGVDKSCLACYTIGTMGDRDGET